MRTIKELEEWVENHDVEVDEALAEIEALKDVLKLIDEIEYGRESVEWFKMKLKARIEG